MVGLIEDQLAGGSITQWAQREYIWNVGNHLWVSWCSLAQLRANKQGWAPCPENSTVTEDTDHSRMWIWDISLRRSDRPAKTLAGGGGCAEWKVDKEDTE